MVYQVSRWGLTYNLYIWSRTSRDTYLDINRITLTPLRSLMIISFVCLRKDSLESKTKLKCLCLSRVTASLPLKIIGGWIGLLFLCEEITCLFLSGLNCIFHWYAHFSINWRSAFKISAETCSSYTIENKEVSPANNLTSETKPSARSLI